VYHHRTVLLIVGAGIFKTEAFGQIVVHLDGAELPAAAESILHHEVELRTIECGFAKFGTCFQTLLLTGLYDGLLGEMPVFIRSDIFLLVVGVAK
jgi:hypothetical protein